jgi:hypothetical protein
LEFHLAHLKLLERKRAPGATSAGDAGTSESIADLSFFTSGHLLSQSPSEYAISQAHITIVVSGPSNTQWTGYAFSSTGLGRDQDEGEYEGDNEDECKSDFFAADRDDDYIIDADIPEWDARKYWLRTVAIRCDLVLKEWLYLVYTIEERLQALVRHHPHLQFGPLTRKRANDPCSNSNGSMHLDPLDVQKSLDWTLQAMQLLRTLLDSLSVTLRAYERFDAADGDKCYFSDLRDSDTRLVQNGIKATFEKLADLHLKLISMDDSCQRFATHVRICKLSSMHH